MPDKPKSEEFKDQAVAVLREDPDIHELVFTVRASTGEVLKVETLGKGATRQELNEEEYAMLAASMVPAAMGLDALQPAAAAAVDPYALLYQGYVAAGLDFEGAYYQGVADYAAALQASTAQSWAATPEGMAYYQGMADYAASIS